MALRLSMVDLCFPSCRPVTLPTSSWSLFIFFSCTRTWRAESNVVSALSTSTRPKLSRSISKHSANSWSRRAQAAESARTRASENIDTSIICSHYVLGVLKYMYKHRSCLFFYLFTTQNPQILTIFAESQLLQYEWANMVSLSAIGPICWEVAIKIKEHTSNILSKSIF